MQSVVNHPYLNIPQPVNRLLEMLMDMFGESEYKLVNILLKDFGSKILYPMLQHSEQTKRLRVNRKNFEKAQERYESALNRHSLGKDDLVIQEGIDNFLGSNILARIS
jgi:hypothetical protein